MIDARTKRILRQHVETDALLGVDAVPVMVRVTTQSAIAAGPTSSVEDSLSHEKHGSAGASPAHASHVADLCDGTQLAQASPSQVVMSTIPSGALFPTIAPTAFPVMARQTKIQILQALDRDEVSPCRKCVLCEARTHTVFGEGDPDAAVMFVGEGPGENEDLQGRPFVGRAGELLNKQIVAMGFAREQVYIANVVKCRPPGNRTPTPQEIESCWNYLQRQIQTIGPRVIVTLGAPATKTLLQTQAGITSIRGIWHQFSGLAPHGPIVPVMPTFHPAYLLRAYTEENRMKVWSDLKKVLAFLKSGALA